MEKKFNQYFKDKKLWFVIISLLIFIFINGEVLTTQVYNGDGVARSYNVMNNLTAGRFMRKPLSVLLSYGTVSPLNQAGLTYLFMVLSTWTLVKLFDVKSLFKSILIFVIIASYPMFAIFWWYSNDIIHYSLCLFLSVLAIYNLSKNTLKSKVIAISLVVVVLGVYQAFLSVITGLFLGYNLWQLHKQEKLDLKKVVIDFLLLVLAAAIYFVVLQVLLVVYGVDMTEYRGADTIGVVSIIKNIPHSIVISYIDFTKYILGIGTVFGSSYNFLVVNVLIYLSLPLTLIQYIRERKSIVTITTMTIGFLLIPIFVNSHVFLTSEILDYTVFGYLISYLIAVIFWCELTKSSNIVWILIIISCYLNIGQVQQMLHFEVAKTELTEQVATNIIMDIVSLDEYTNQDEIVMCGLISDNENISYANPTNFEIEQRLYNEGPLTPVFLQQKFTYVASQIGYQLNVPKETDYDCSQVDNNPSYPKTGYITQSDDKIVVKLSEKR